ncbi:MAG: gamma-glutamyl-gamma-aminobutyrate hydrolase family protein [Lactimicrobium sp.]|jgi:putative glutamine amidotransferase|uniref:gamma-glutamyl-gamma-aminobutyrate hydrolase family protein n=1 Tax=Lactimicrobium sp. TaxID=2563780 RepID=UPI002F3517EF
MRKMKIGLLGNLEQMDTKDVFIGTKRAYVNQDYVDSIAMAGGIPIILPVIADLDDVSSMVSGLDGVIVTGGEDLDPLLYGEQVLPACGMCDTNTDRFFLSVIHACDELAIPVFGICKGLQAINAAYGGTLYQDIPSQVEKAIQHDQKRPRDQAVHSILIQPFSFLGGVLGDRVMVNSWHHQSVKTVANGFHVTATAPDGIVEGMEKDEGTFMCGVQFHPEMMAACGNRQMLSLFQAFLHVCQEKHHD